VRLLVLWAAVLAAAGLAVLPAQGYVLEIASVSPSGMVGNGPSQQAVMSSNGRFIAFQSDANNLVAGDSNGVTDIFVYDTANRVTELASMGLGGALANGPSGSPSISADGRFIAFHSLASNLVLADGNSNWDVFVYDRQTRRLDRVSLNSNGVEGNGWSKYPSISASGDFVAFVSAASNLAPGSNPGATGVYVRDRLLGKTMLASVDSAGIAANRDSSEPAISGNGRFVAFATAATNLWPVDTNGKSDIYLRDLSTGQTYLVSCLSGGQARLGTSSHPAINHDGLLIAYEYSQGTPGTRTVYVFNRATGYAHQLAAPWQDDGKPVWPTMSSDGMTVAFASPASLTVGDSNGCRDVVFCYWSTNTLVSPVHKLASVGLEGEPVLEDVGHPCVSPDGYYVVFEVATALAPQDVNGISDIYLAISKLSRPAAPTDTTAEAGSDNDVAVQWQDNSTNEAGFTIERKIGPDGTWAVVGTVAANTEKWAEGPLFDSKFYYRVQAQNDAGRSGYSNEAYVPEVRPWKAERTNWYVPYGNNWHRTGWIAKPGAIKMRLHFGAIELEPMWDKLVSDVGDEWSGTYYDVLSGEKAGAAINLTLTSDVEKTGYFYIDRVEYQGISTGAAYTNGNLFEGMNVPAPPSSLTATASPASPTMVDLNWVDNAANEVSFFVERREAAEFVQIAHLPANTTSYRDNTCAAGVAYTYRVKAANAFGDSAYSNEAAIATGANGYGQLQVIGTGGDTITVLYVGGTPYERGYWHGSLLREQVSANVASILAAAEAEGVSEQELFWAWSQMAPYVSGDFIQEMQGLADGSGVSLQQLQEVHAVPDLSEYQCSAFNAFGPATTNGHMIQLRNLDYMMELGVQDHPLITVGSMGNGQRFADIGFCGFIGSIAGMNSYGMGVSEVGESFDLAHETLAGTPMPFLLRDIIAQGTSFEYAVNLLQGAQRTSSYVYVVGDAKVPTAGVFMASPSIFEYWGPGGVASMDSEPGLPNIVYHGMYNDRLYFDLLSNWGSISPEVAIEISKHNADVGSNLLDAVYDLSTADIWVAYAHGLQDAATRSYVHLNILATPVPPAVVEVQPRGGSLDAPSNQAVTVRFSEPMDASTLTSANFQLVGLTRGLIPGTISYQASTFTMSFVPSSALLPDDYLATITGGAGGVKGSNGLGLNRDYAWGFRMQDQLSPTVAIISPAEGAVVRGIVTILATASDPDGTVDRVVFDIDGNLVTDTAAPYQATWDTRPAAVVEGPHLITARAVDKVGHEAWATLHVVVDNATFDDVPKTSPYWAYVEAMAREKITIGCVQRPPLFCPTDTVARRLMAVFLCRAAGLAPVYPATATFADVPSWAPEYGYVERLYREKIVAGCALGPLRFCPFSPVTKLQMAVFLCRAARIPTVRPAVADFADVPVTHPWYAYVEGVYRAGVMGPCATTPLSFCPNQAVRRWEMAVMLCKAFQIPLN